MMVRRSVPPPIVPAVVRARLHKALRDPVIGHQARLQMEFLLGRTRPDADIEGAARRYIEWEIRRSELRWHPGMLRQRVDGVERLRELIDSPRGMVVTAMHQHGIEFGDSLAHAGLPVHVVAHSNWFLPTTPAWMQQVVRVYLDSHELIDVAAGAPAIASRVARGAAVMLAVDVPGRTPVTFVGRRLLGSSGATRIAVAKKVPLVVLTAHRDGEGVPFLRVSEPLEPGDHGSADALLTEALRRHEEAVLDWPEVLQWPTRRWTMVDEDDRERFSAGPTGWLI
jgi:lauroyl/myristoyl acyltransferase